MDARALLKSGLKPVLFIGYLALLVIVMFTAGSIGNSIAGVAGLYIGLALGGFGMLLLTGIIWARNDDKKYGDY